MRKHVPLLAILLALWLVILSACSPAESETKIATDLSELTLMRLWTTVAEEADIQQDTAILETFHLSTTADGSLERVHFVFHALNDEGRNQVVFVDVNGDGDLTSQQQSVERGDYPLHPADLLAALDEAGLAELAAAKGGLTVLADSIAGDISYRQENADVFLLENGRRRPVQEIVFHSESPWTTITVCAPAADEDREVTERDGVVVVTRTVTAGEGDQCEVWFLEQTAARAAVLEMAESATATPTATTPAPTAAPEKEPTATPAPVSAGDEPPAGLVYRSADGLWMIGVDGEPERLFEHPEAILSRQYALYPAEGELWLANTGSGERRPLIPDEERLSCCASWWPARPDTVLTTSWPAGIDRGLGGDVLAGYLTAVDVASGDHRVLDAEHDTLGQIAPSSSLERTVAYGGGERGWLYHWEEERVEVFDPTAYELPDNFEVRSVTQPAWDPDGERIAWIVQGTLDGENVLAVGVFNPESGGATLIHPYTPLGTDAFPPAPQFSPDGEWIAFVTWDSDGRDAGYWLASTAGEQKMHLVPTTALATAPPVWRPDGAYLAITRVPQEEAAPTQTFLFAAGEQTALPVTMPADDAVVVEWRMPGQQ